MKLLALHCTVIFAFLTSAIVPLHAATVAYWRFDEGTGSTAFDSSPFGNTAIINQGNLYSMDVAASVPVNGVPNDYSLHLNGTGQFAMAADSISLRPSSSITMEATVKLSRNIAGNAGIIGRQLGASGGDSFNLGLRGVLNNPFVSIQLGGTSASVDLPESLVVGQWYNLVATWNGSELSLFVNGDLKGSVPAIGSISYLYSNPVVIGADNEASGYLEWFFPGWIDEVRISDSALAPSQFLAAPEPSTFVFAVVGLVGLLACRRRRLSQPYNVRDRSRSLAR